MANIYILLSFSLIVIFFLDPQEEVSVLAFLFEQKVDVSEAVQLIR